MEATCRLVEKLGGTIVGTCFMIELGFLKERSKLVPYPVRSLTNLLIVLAIFVLLTALTTSYMRDTW